MGSEVPWAAIARFSGPASWFRVGVPGPQRSDRVGSHGVEQPKQPTDRLWPAIGVMFKLL
jgi:hypothetical protein